MKKLRSKLLVGSMKKNKNIILVILVILLLSYVGLNSNNIIGNFKYPLGDIDNNIVKNIDFNILNQTFKTLIDHKVRYYAIGSEEYTYYNQGIDHDLINSLDLKKSTNVKDLKIKDIFISNSINSVYFDGYIYYFKLIESDLYLGYSEATNYRLGSIINKTRVDKIINDNWMILRECNKYICGKEVY